MAHHELATPITEQQARALRVNDTVTLQKTLFGLRDATLIHLSIAAARHALICTGMR